MQKLLSQENQKPSTGHSNFGFEGYPKMSYSDLKGKVFIVTGASSGMGKAISLLLAKQGAKIGLLDLRKPDHVLEEIEKAGAEALSVECNVQDADAVDKAVQRVALHFGRLDGAANMAGYLYNSATKGVPVADLKDKDWDNMISTNLNGVKNSIRAELNHMKSTGSIVNAGSISGQQGSPNHASYSVSKWGVIGLSKVVAQEVRERGIRVNAVAP